MAVYRNMADFHAKLDVEKIKCRGDFLWKVKWAKIEDTTPHRNTENLKGMLFAMHIGLLPDSYSCEACGREYYLSYRNDSDTWQWRQQDGACPQCTGTRRSLTRGTVLEQVRAANWLNFFDAYCMWTLDYPRKLMEQEIKVQHQAWLLWEKRWYAAVALDLETRLTSHSLAATPPKSANQVRAMKKPAASYKKPAGSQKKPAGAKACKKKPAASKKTVMKHIRKRPAASCGVLKRPAKFVARKQRATPDPMNFYKKYKYVIEIDESHLNKSKPGALTRTGRVQADPVWVWGATIPRMPGRFLFRVLEHPVDAEAGRPRGKEEILKCLHLLNIPHKTILVTDGWKSTKAAIEEFKKESGRRSSTTVLVKLSMRMASPPTTLRTGGALSRGGSEKEWAAGSLCTRTVASGTACSRNSLGERPWQKQAAWTMGIPWWCRSQLHCKACRPTRRL